MTTGKTIALIRRTFVSKVMPLLFNMLSRLVIAFLPRSKYLNFMAPKSLQMVTVAMKLRCLLLGRKVMANLDSILKSRDITLLTKVCVVKAMVSPVVMYGCECWTIKKAEHQRTDAFNCGVGEDSREPL